MISDEHHCDHVSPFLTAIQRGRLCPTVVRQPGTGLRGAELLALTSLWEAPSLRYIGTFGRGNLICAALTRCKGAKHRDT